MSPFHWRVTEQNGMYISHVFWFFSSSQARRSFPSLECLLDVFPNCVLVTLSLSLYYLPGNPTKLTTYLTISYPFTIPYAICMYYYASPVQYPTTLLRQYHTLVSLSHQSPNIPIWKWSNALFSLSASLSYSSPSTLIPLLLLPPPRPPLTSSWTGSWVRLLERAFRGVFSHKMLLVSRNL